MIGKAPLPRSITLNEEANHQLSFVDTVAPDYQQDHHKCGKHRPNPHPSAYPTVHPADCMIHHGFLRKRIALAVSPVRVVSPAVYCRNRVDVAVTTGHSSVSARSFECAAFVPSATDLSATDPSAVDRLDCSEPEVGVDPVVVDSFDRSEIEPAVDPAADSVVDFSDHSEPAVDLADHSEADCGLAYARTLSTL